MSGRIRCPNSECRSTDIHNIHAEGNVGPRAEGKPLPRSKGKGPKYECCNCGHQFDV